MRSVIRRGADLPLYWMRIQALVAREVKSRFAGDVVGYAWAYLVPLTWILVIYVAFSFLGRRSPIDTDIGSFIISGVLPYLVFRYSINSVIRARSSYREIVRLATLSRPLVYFSIALIEYYNALVLFVLLLVANYVFFGHFEMADPLGALWGFTLAWALGASVGFLVVSLARSTEVAIRLTPIVLRPMFYFSGIFYVATELPSGIQAVLSYNPMLQAIELLRSAQFRAYESPIANSVVPLVWIAALLVLATLAELAGRADVSEGVEA